ncbi:MAG: hypothetical protein GEU88_11380 [Solirubrobacterales bacterium]|nr:hypothetical protein [Solirubrobacterales bacterium]
MRGARRFAGDFGVGVALDPEPDAPRAPERRLAAGVADRDRLIGERFWARARLPPRACCLHTL